MSLINGSLPNPNEGAINEQAWKRCNNMIIEWIISSLDRHNKMIMGWIIPSLERHNKNCYVSKEDEWHLKGSWSICGTLSSSHIYRPQEKLLNTIEEPDMSISNYFTKVKSLWDNINDLPKSHMTQCISAKLPLGTDTIIIFGFRRRLHRGTFANLSRRWWLTPNGTTTVEWTMLLY